MLEAQFFCEFNNTIEHIGSHDFIIVWQVSQDSGSLTKNTTFHPSSEFDTCSDARRIVNSSNGKHLYYLTNDCLMILNVNSDYSMELYDSLFLGDDECSADKFRDILMPDDEHLYLVYNSGWTPGISKYQVDSATGALTFDECVSGIGGYHYGEAVMDAVCSPDNCNNIYVMTVTYSRNGIMVFSRDVDTGVLTAESFAETIVFDANRLTMSLDGASLSLASLTCCPSHLDTSGKGTGDGSEGSGTYTLITIFDRSAPSLNLPMSTCSPSSAPTNHPTPHPTETPSIRPTYQPTTASPSLSPTYTPSSRPTSTPTENPTKSPSEQPTLAPTRSPSLSPTAVPSISRRPTLQPTLTPTSSPTPCDLYLDNAVCVSTCPSYKVIYKKTCIYGCPAYTCQEGDFCSDIPVTLIFWTVTDFSHLEDPEQKELTDKIIEGLALLSHSDQTQYKVLNLGPDNLELEIFTLYDDQKVPIDIATILEQKMTNTSHSLSNIVGMDALDLFHDPIFSTIFGDCSAGNVTITSIWQQENEQIAGICADVAFTLNISSWPSIILALVSLLMGVMVALTIFFKIQRPIIHKLQPQTLGVSGLTVSNFSGGLTTITLSVADSLTDIIFLISASCYFDQAIFLASLTFFLLQSLFAIFLFFYILYFRPELIDTDLALQQSNLFLFMAMLSLLDLELLAAFPWALTQNQCRYYRTSGGFPNKTILKATSAKILLENVPAMVIQSIALSKQSSTAAACSIAFTVASIVWKLFQKSLILALGN